MKHDIGKIKLPQDSRNEQLETISKNCFRPLFDVNKFILKEETIDNGIDFRIELKNDGNKLGFGLNFQLKSSENTVSNNDGSYSKSIETSNIEYLLNNGQSAYYGFYIVNKHKFFFENLKTILFDLNRKDPDWQNQSSHTIRFSKGLDSVSIDEIYTNTLKDGSLIRKIHSKLAESINDLESNNKIIIDYNGNLDSDEEIENFICKYGLFLNDNCKWNEILNLHNKTSTGSVKSSLYNFIIGLSLLYSGNYLQSLELFRKARLNSITLPDDIKDYLTYYYAELSLLFNLIKEEDYLREIQNASKNDNLRYHLELAEIDNFKIEMYSSENLESISFEQKMNEFLNNSNIDLKVRQQGKISLLSYKAEKLICQAPFILAYINDEYLRLNFVELNKEFKETLIEFSNKGSEFLIHSCSLNHNKFLIQFDALYKIHNTTCFDKELLEDIVSSIKIAYKYFLDIGHLNNQVYSLSILLEAYQDLENEDEVNDTIIKLEEYANKYCNPELNNKIEFIKNGGTFVNHMMNKRKSFLKLKTEIDEMRNELIEIDKTEEIQKVKHDDTLVIHLFPIGYFEFPKNQIKKVFEILEVEDENLKSHFLYLFEFVIPAVNTYTVKIENEGLSKGILEYRGIESYRKMYRVRKLFYDNKFYRIELKF